MSESSEHHHLFFAAQPDGELDMDTEELVDAWHSALPHLRPPQGEGQLIEFLPLGEDVLPQYFADQVNRGLIKPSAEYRISRTTERWAVWASPEGGQDAHTLTDMFYAFAESQGDHGPNKSMAIQPEWPDELQVPTTDFDVEDAIMEIAVEPDAQFAIPQEPGWVNVAISQITDRRMGKREHNHSMAAEKIRSYLESIRRLRHWRDGHGGA